MSIQSIARSIPFASKTHRYILEKTYTQFNSEVVMDICTICKSNCVYCLHQRNRLIKPQLMYFDVFTKIAYILAKENIKKVHLFQSGEPFIHPKIYEMTELLTMLGIKVTIGTRLNCKIDHVRLENIASNSHSIIEFLITIDSISNPELISPGIDKDLVWDNLLQISNLLKYKNVKFQLSTVVSSKNEGVIYDVKSILRGLGFKNWYATGMAYYMWNLASQDDLDTMSKYLTASPKFRSRFDIKDGKVVDKPIHCNNLIPTISVNGDVSICCHDMLHQINTGNIVEVGSLNDIISGEKYQKFKKLAKEVKLDMCKVCN